MVKIFNRRIICNDWPEIPHLNQTSCSRIQGHIFLSFWSPRTLSLNPFAKRFVPAIKQECLDPMIFFGAKMFRHAVHEYVRHDPAERNHQDLENRLIQPEELLDTANGEIECRERLGGLLKYDHRRAA